MPQSCTAVPESKHTKGGQKQSRTKSTSIFRDVCCEELALQVCWCGSVEDKRAIRNDARPWVCQSLYPNSLHNFHKSLTSQLLLDLSPPYGHKYAMLGIMFLALHCVHYVSSRFSSESIPTGRPDRDKKLPLAHLRQAKDRTTPPIMQPRILLTKYSAM